MLEPDLAVSRRFIDANPPPGRLLLCAITGSHHYGFPSANSDLDIKRVHLAPTRSVLGLGKLEDSHDALEIFEGVECDLTTNEAGQALALLLGGNGNMLERIFSPYQLGDDDELAELRELARGALSRRCYRHYHGYFRGMQREHLLKEPPRAKSLLYTFRVALTGTHLLRTGEVVASLPELAERYGYADVRSLIDIKRGGHEKQEISMEVAERFRALWPRLDAWMTESLESSPLPEEPANRAACDAWLVARRIRELD